MAFTHYTFMISQAPRSMVRAWLNDVPFFRFYGGPAINRTGPAVHLLVPGENTFAIEIERAPQLNELFFELSVNQDHDHPALYFAYPREALHLTVDRRTPFRWEARFTPPGELFSPAWLTCVPSSIPCAGTKELRAALSLVHAAIEAQDVGAYCAELAWKAREMERAYPGFEGASAEDMREGVADFFAMRPAVRPLDFDDLHFEERADGRLAHVRRTSGGHVLEAVSEVITAEGDRAGLFMDPTFAWLDGAWRLLY